MPPAGSRAPMRRGWSSSAVGNGEGVADEIPARGDLALEPIDRSDHLRAAVGGCLGVDLEPASHTNTQHWEAGAEQGACCGRLTVGEQRHYQLWMGKQFVVEGAADVRSELLVEELLKLTSSSPPEPSKGTSPTPTRSSTSPPASNSPPHSPTHRRDHGPCRHTWLTAIDRSPCRSQCMSGRPGSGTFVPLSFPSSTPAPNPNAENARLRESGVS
jgi:hypothetical protein